jgi:DNA-binding CsgD family transcriptional regulator
MPPDPFLSIEAAATPATRGERPEWEHLPPLTETLPGRASECRTLDRLLDSVRAGGSAALVVRGAPGVGKTALLDYVRVRASGCRLASAAGVWSERELPFAGLHQLCAPLLDGLDDLPGPQRDALRTAFALSLGGPPHPFLVSLAALSLLSEAAESRPLICLVDDAEWLDRASLQALAFAARRLVAESVALVFAVRDECGELAGLPQLVVEGLREADARALLGAALRAPLDERVRDRIVAETGGNPLALLELPRGLTPAELAGGFGLPSATPLSSRIEEGFRRRLAPLPPRTRLLLLVAAAEPVGEPTLVWRAAARLGLGVNAVAAAAAAGLLVPGAALRFRHPLMRSAVYRAASPADRRRVHAALAEVTDAEADPDRRAWHRAHAASEPDEAVAEELERWASRAQARGGVAAAAAFLERAVVLTPEPGRRALRALAAAEAKHQAGAADAALALLATAHTGPLDEVGQTRVDLLRAQIAFTSSRAPEAPTLLLKAAERLAQLDPALSRETYLDAFAAATCVPPPPDAIGLPEIARAARSAPPPARPGAADVLLDGLTQLVTEGYAAAPTLERALHAFRTEVITSERQIGRLWLACRTAVTLWQDDTWDVLSARFIRLAHETGAVAVLPLALHTRAIRQVLAGELAAAAALVEEAEGVLDATRSHLSPCGAIALAAWRGNVNDASALIESGERDAVMREEETGPGLAQWASGVLYNGLGRYEEALTATQRGAANLDDTSLPGAAPWVLVELVEAAARGGELSLAEEALEGVAEAAQASGTDWALGVEARSRALVSEGEDADGLYQAAIDRLRCTRMRAELARAHLVYGEWLRRERRHRDARNQLRTALAMFRTMGAQGFADRTGRELLATGESARKRTIDARGKLTAQEAEVARLARDGLSNADIGGRLFISPRTVEYHLHKVFAKLDITSRMQLAHALDDTRV